MASIYRTLELLDKLRLTRRVDAAEGVARYEPVGTERRASPPPRVRELRRGLGVRGPELERAIERLARRSITRSTRTT